MKKIHRLRIIDGIKYLFKLKVVLLITHIPQIIKKFSGMLLKKNSIQ
ncbi:hypothetical protein [Clostridium sp.]